MYKYPLRRRIFYRKEHPPYSYNEELTIAIWTTPLQTTKIYKGFLDVKSQNPTFA